MIKDNINTEIFRNEDEKKLCEALEAAIYGDILPENLQNNGVHSTKNSEEEAYSRLDKYIDTELSDYIGSL